MTKHLSDDALLEMAETGKSHPHVAECDRCRRVFEDAREALTLARADEVPEPSPLFWEHFSARVREAVANDTRVARLPAFGWFRLPGWRPVVAVALVVLAVAGIVWRGRPTHQPEGQTKASHAKGVVTPAAQPMVTDVQASADVMPPAADSSLNVIAQITAHMEISSATDAGLVLQAGAADRAIAQLTPSEQQELIRLLQADPDGPSW